MERVERAYLVSASWKRYRGRIDRMRRPLRPLPPQHQREAPPLPHRQGRLQAADRPQARAGARRGVASCECLTNPVHPRPLTSRMIDLSLGSASAGGREAASAAPASALPKRRLRFIRSLPFRPRRPAQKRAGGAFSCLPAEAGHDATLDGRRTVLRDRLGRRGLDASGRRRCAGPLRGAIGAAPRARRARRGGPPRRRGLVVAVAQRARVPFRPRRGDVPPRRVGRDDGPGPPGSPWATPGSAWKSS